MKEQEQRSASAMFLQLYTPPLGTGYELYFCGTNGVVYTNRVTGTRNIARTDIQIVSLQNELPDAVTPAYLLPTNFHEYISTGKYLPVLRFDQNERCVINEISDGLPTISSAETGLFHTSVPRVAHRTPFYDYLRSGDSGNPLFLILGNKPILLGTAYWGLNEISNGVYRTCRSPFVTYYTNEIQAKMDELVPGYSLQFVDLTPFPKLRRVR